MRRRLALRSAARGPSLLLLAFPYWEQTAHENHRLEKSRFLCHKQAVGYARETGHSPLANGQVDGSPARHSPQPGVIFFSVQNHPNRCYIRTQPFPNVRAAVGRFVAAFPPVANITRRDFDRGL